MKLRTSALKTSSKEATQIISALSPIHIRTEDKTQRYPKQNWKTQINEQRQQEWGNNTGKAVKTKILIKDLVSSSGRWYGETDYYLTQILRRHGWFGRCQRRFHHSIVRVLFLPWSSYFSAISCTWVKKNRFFSGAWNLKKIGTNWQIWPSQSCQLKSIQCLKWVTRRNNNSDPSSILHFVQGEIFSYIWDHIWVKIPCRTFSHTYMRTKE